MIYMFNELSLSQVNSIADAKRALETFIKAVIRVSELGFTEMRLYESALQNLYHLNLYNGYRIDTWLNDSEVNSDLKIRFKEIIATPPLINDDEVAEKETYEWSMFQIDLDNKKERVYGLGAAHVFGTLSVSLSTHPIWSSSNLSIYHDSLSKEGNETNTQIDIRHFSTVENVNYHQQWIAKEQKDSLEKSHDLWDRREEYFPNILFGIDVESQILSLGLSKKLLKVFDCLKRLNAFCESWTKVGFDLNDLKENSLLDISGESECTMKKYSVIRKFKLPKGQKVQFELHIKVPDVRIYILPDETTHKIIVGYIGKHLPTCLYN